MEVKVSIVLCMCCCIVSAWKLICPDRSHRKNRAQGFCNDSSWKKYSCLFDKNYKTFNESCSLKPDIVPPGNKYVIKSVPAGEKCDTNKFQPVKLWLNESSDCEFFKDKCSAQGQTIFRNLTSKEDRTCRCCFEIGFAYIRPPKNRCFCNPFQEDCSCYFKKSSSTKTLSPDYNCVPPNDFNSNGKCPSYLQKQIEDFHKTTDKSVSLLKVIIVVILFTVLCIVYTVYEDRYDDADSFRLKVQGHWRSHRSDLLKRLPVGNILQELTEFNFITETIQMTIDSRYTEHQIDYILIAIYENCRAIYRLSKKKNCNWGDNFVNKICQSVSPVKYTAYLDKPKGTTNSLKQWIRDNKQEFLEVVRPKCWLFIYEFVEKLVFDISDLKKILDCESTKGICEFFLYTIESTEEKGSFELLDEVLSCQDGLAQKMLINGREYNPKTRSISLIECLIHDEDEKSVHSGLLDIRMFKSSGEPFELNTFTSQQIQTTDIICRIMVLQELGLHTFKTSCSGNVFNVLNHTTVKALRKIIEDGRLTNIIKTYIEHLSSNVDKSGHSLTLEVRLIINEGRDDELEEENNAFTNFADESYQTTNTIAINKTIFMHEIDTDLAIKVLKANNCDTSDITGSREEKIPKIYDILEKYDHLYLTSLLEELHIQGSELLYNRLKICGEIFSSDIDKNTLRNSILSNAAVILSTLIDNNYLSSILNCLEERNVIRNGCVYISNQTYLNKILTIEMIVYIIKQGKYSMLHFVDSLYQCENDENKLAFKIMHCVPNQIHSTDNPDEKKTIRTSLTDGLIICAKYKCDL